MFVKQPESAYPLGIRPYRMTGYVWERALLRGRVAMAQDEPHECLLSVEPHLPRLRALDGAPQIRNPRSLRPTFNEARNLTLYLGAYPSLDTIESYTATLEGFFRAVLADKGAEHRILEGDRLAPTDRETEATFGEALKLARDVEVYAALRAGENLPFSQIVGRVFRSLAHTLGVNYSISEERDVANPREYRSVTFAYDGIGMFTFTNNGPDVPVTVTRLSHGGGDRYYQSFEGPATMANMQRHVFNWLIDAMREITPQRLESGFDYDSFLKNREAAEKRFYGNMKADDGFRHNGTGRVNFMRLVK